MKKNLLFIFASALVACIISCSDSKVNPLWGMWTLQSEQSGSKTEIMFTDDYTGFVIVDEDVKYETSWQQDSVLRVNYFEMSTGKKGLGVRKTYSVDVDGDILTLKDIESGEVSKYSRFVE